MLGRSRIGIALGALALAAAGVLACSSFSGSDQANPADASPNAGGDGASAADGAVVGPFCNSVDASFCWSFDQGPDNLRGSQLQASPNTPPVLTDGALSPPYAMRTGPDAGDTSYLKVEGTPATAARCELDLFVDSIGVRGTNVLFLVPPTFPNYALVLDVDMTGISAFVEINADRIFVANVPPGVWTHMALQVSLGSTIRATGFVGTSQAVKERALPEGGPTTFGSTSAEFGLTFGAPGWVIRYDNLSCQWD